MDTLGSHHNVVTYVGRSNLNEDDMPMEAAFLKPDLSVNWLEYYSPPKVNQVNRARDDMANGIRLGTTGRLAELNVGESCNRVKVNTGEIILFKKDGRPANPSHCEVKGIPPDAATERQSTVAVSLAAGWPGSVPSAA
jgi:hypothetical protein